MKIAFLLLFSILLNAKFIDNDLDGVEDSKDLCPNSKLFELVDENGCATKILIDYTKTINYTLSVSYIHNSDKNEDNAYSLNLFFNYINFDLSLNYLKYINDNNLNELAISAYYSFKDTINTTIGIGSYLPQHSSKSNKVDYFIGIKIAYEFKDFNCYISYKRYFNNDLETYNSNLYKLGVGYYAHNNLYTSLTYINSDSIYNSNEQKEHISIFTNYYLNKKLFISTNYAISLNSNSDNSYSITIGYDF